jgi:aspartyl-tRNA(Asn)/glutamyl-tRNA(Gln) amidotransferase subunit A
MKSLILTWNNKKRHTDFSATNAVITNNDKITLGSNTETNSILHNIPYVAKDLFITSDLPTTAGSKTLASYLPPYDATVYKILKENGAVLLNKTNLDEFGMGGTGLNSASGPIINPFNKERIVGGSSSGNAVVVALGVIPFAIGTDTGDSVRSPASYMGIYGYKPTYGLISRYGVIPYAPSLDHVGINANSVTDLAIVAQTLMQYDEKDFTSQKFTGKVYNELKTLDKMNIAVIKGIEEYLDEEVKEIYLDNIAQLKKQYNVIEKDFPLNLWEAISPVYMVLSYAEAFSCLSQYTSIPYGKNDGLAHGFDQTITQYRTAGFSFNVKKKIMMGAYFLEKNNHDHIYLKAKKVRTLLIDKYNELMDNVYCLIFPSHSRFAPFINDLQNNSLNRKEKWLVADLLNLANFAGSPSITIPTYKRHDKNFGLNINTKQFFDQMALDCALALENFFDK